jgi:hypothetical protein
VGVKIRHALRRVFVEFMSLEKVVDLSQSNSGGDSNVEWIGVIPSQVLLCNINDDLFLLLSKFFGGIVGDEGSEHMRGHLRVVSKLSRFEKRKTSSSRHFHG